MTLLLDERIFCAACFSATRHGGLRRDGEYLVVSGSIQDHRHVSVRNIRRVGVRHLRLGRPSGLRFHSA
jgi:hypothetical protein